MTRTSLLGAVALLSLATAVSAQTERRTIRGERVAIANIVGKLRVESGTGSEVGVEITRGGRDGSRLTIETGTDGGTQTLRVVYPESRIVYPELGRGGNVTTSMGGRSANRFGVRGGGSGWFNNDRIEIRSSGSGLEAWADIRVTVPRGQRVDLTWGAGDVTITNVEGTIDVDVAAATTKASGVKGDLSLDTGSGRVTVDDLQGSLTLDTGSGAVTLSRIRGDRIDLDSGSGSVSADDIDVREIIGDVGSGGFRLTRIRAKRVDLDTGSGSTELEMLSDVEDLRVDAGSGGVSVRLPSNTSAMVDVETGSGGIDSDFSMTMNSYRRNELHGKIGDGRGRIRIETGSGSVRLIKGS